MMLLTKEIAASGPEPAEDGLSEATVPAGVRWRFSFSFLRAERSLVPMKSIRAAKMATTLHLTLR